LKKKGAELNENSTVKHGRMKKAETMASAIGYGS